VIPSPRAKEERRYKNNVTEYHFCGRINN